MLSLCVEAEKQPSTGTSPGTLGREERVCSARCGATISGNKKEAPLVHGPHRGAQTWEGVKFQRKAAKTDC